MANTAIVIAQMDPILMRLERGADMVRSWHWLGVSARGSAGNSRPDTGAIGAIRRVETMLAKPAPNASFG